MVESYLSLIFSVIAGTLFALHIRNIEKTYLKENVECVKAEYIHVAALRGRVWKCIFKRPNGDTFEQTATLKVKPGMVTVYTKGEKFYTKSELIVNKLILVAIWIFAISSGLELIPGIPL